MYRKSNPYRNDACSKCVYAILLRIFFSTILVWFYVYKIKRTTSKKKFVCIGAYTLYIRIQYAHMYREESKEKRISKTDHCYHELAIFMPSVTSNRSSLQTCVKMYESERKFKTNYTKYFFLFFFFSFSSSFFLKSSCILRHLVFREDRYRRNL